MPKLKWKKAKYPLIPSGLITIASIALATVFFNVSDRKLDHRVIAYTSVVGFLFFGLIFLQIFTSMIYESMVSHRLGIGRAAAIQFMLRLIGYIVLLLSGLEMINISVAKLLLGGAVIGIILGVAAQQALANFFASIVLIISHPFRVGEEIVLFSGALGGKYEGTVLDIGLTHTRIRQEDESVVFMPNATLLAGAAIVPAHGLKKR